MSASDRSVLPFEPSEVIYGRRFVVNLWPTIAPRLMHWPLHSKTVDLPTRFVRLHHWASHPAAVSECAHWARDRRLIVSIDPRISGRCGDGRLFSGGGKVAVLRVDKNFPFRKSFGAIWLGCRPNCYCVPVDRDSPGLDCDIVLGTPIKGSRRVRSPPQKKKKRKKKKGGGESGLHWLCPAVAMNLLKCELFLRRIHKGRDLAMVAVIGLWHLSVS